MKELILLFAGFVLGVIVWDKFIAYWEENAIVCETRLDGDFSLETAFKDELWYANI